MHTIYHDALHTILHYTLYTTYNSSCWTTHYITLPELPTRPYLTVLSAGSTDVCPYLFLKIWTQCFQKVQKLLCEQMQVRCQRSTFMGSYHSLTFAYFKPLPRLKYTANPFWLKKFVKPVNINFASKLYRN